MLPILFYEFGIGTEDSNINNTVCTDLVGILIIIDNSSLAKTILYKAMFRNKNTKVRMVILKSSFFKL